jgi:hypothetical protein
MIKGVAPTNSLELLDLNKKFFDLMSSYSQIMISCGRNYDRNPLSGRFTISFSKSRILRTVRTLLDTFNIQLALVNNEENKIFDKHIENLNKIQSELSRSRLIKLSSVSTAVFAGILTLVPVISGLINFKSSINWVVNETLIILPWATHVKFSFLYVFAFLLYMLVYPFVILYILGYRRSKRFF